MDPAVKEYIGERFVPVWIDDKEKEKFASGVLKLSDMGYPNIALFDAAGDYYGRVVGFGGLDGWFQGLRESVDRGARIDALKGKLDSDPAAGAALATLLAEVPDREDRALELFAAAPEEARTPEVVAAEVKLRGKLAWRRTSRTINDEFQSLLQGVDRKNRDAMGKALKDAYAKMAPRVKKEVDEFLASFPNAEQAADALMTKANVLVQSDAVQEGIEAFEAFLARFENHPARARVEKMLEAARQKLADLEKAAKDGPAPAPEGGDGK